MLIGKSSIGDRRAERKEGKKGERGDLSKSGQECFCDIF